MEKSIRLSDHFSYSKLLRFTLPSIVMMVFTSIYGVVDGLFVSNFVGKTAFASVNLVMPFVMILGGMGFMLGTGGTALVSKILGEGDPDSANRTFSMMVLFTLALGAVLSAAGIVFMRPVSRFLGATDAMMDDCVLYGRIVTPVCAECRHFAAWKRLRDAVSSGRCVFRIPQPARFAGPQFHQIGPVLSGPAILRRGSGRVGLCLRGGGVVEAASR
mgnify:CR=1 FL=1